jgi:hypothetical protein
MGASGLLMSHAATTDSATRSNTQPIPRCCKNHSKPHETGEDAEQSDRG